MRRNLALTLLAMLALTISLAAIGCGAKQEEPAATSETMSTETMPSDSMMADTAMHQH